MWHSLVAFWAKTLDINDKPLLTSSIVWSRVYISDIEFISHEVILDIVNYRKIKYPHVGSFLAAWMLNIYSIKIVLSLLLSRTKFS